MVSRRTRVACWIFRRDHPSRPKAMICCFFSSFKTFAILREATYPPAAVNVLVAPSESMAAFQVFLYGRFWVFTEDQWKQNQNGGHYHTVVTRIRGSTLRLELMLPGAPSQLDRGGVSCSTIWDYTLVYMSPEPLPYAQEW